MLLQQLLDSMSPLILIGIGFAGLTAHLLHNKFGTGLNHVPGPFWASFTEFYRLFVVWQRRPEQWHIRLHQQYGPFVRIGPRTVICSDNKAAKKIYALNAGYVKSDFYLMQQAIAKGVPLQTLFTATDEVLHAKLRRATSNAYAMSSLVQFEPFVNSTIREFIKQLHERYVDDENADKILDFGEWLQLFAFDVICELTFSKRMGFVERGEDVGNIISNLQWMLNYSATAGQVPWLDKLFLKNPIRRWMSAHGLLGGSPAVQFALKCMSETKTTTNTGKIMETTRRDFLSRFQEAHDKDPRFITRERVVALTTANMIAGSDTTGISLRAIFYNLIRNPDKLAKLHAELDHVVSKRGVNQGDGLFAWDEVRELPYLSAVINESLRTHPAAGLALERITPVGGLQHDGVVIPGGTNIGCNAWVLHLDEQIWGPKPKEWIPERWIDASSVHKSEMKNSLFSFGAGARTCLGKNISYLEMYKLVPALLREFDIELAYPEKEWSLHNAWFVKQSDFYVKLRLRQPTMSG
ncbi:hypothetical protein HBI88_170060 [Parastagonospora nodorum]|nr:hypothetical protein HBI97_161470 [Parastagonospora nodorum]KAH5801021.1 hypothetical protein HBI96_146670 [Parastagonospora nodorum]KAH5815591.1 hypothetical protein HBI94_129510 [Parastagonospora nodorum]KAH5820873.1 hypothetical protein HBI93_176710 [Parastagonospora nodorum]KAH5862307.1 hypothetical protein HBI91_122380 [Parastagonospora nodorum]